MSADLLIELCACYLLSGFGKVVCVYSPLLKGRSLCSFMYLLCSCARFIIKFTAQLALGVYLDILRSRWELLTQLLNSIGISLFFSFFLPHPFYFFPLCFKVSTKCFEKVWNIDSEAWSLIIQEKLFKYSRSVEAFNISILPTKVIFSLSICPLF